MKLSARHVLTGWVVRGVRGATDAIRELGPRPGERALIMKALDVIAGNE